MPLRVWSMVQYLTGSVDQMRRGDYATIMIVKAVKGRQFNGYCKPLRFLDKKYEFSSQNPQPAVDLWTAWAAHLLKQIAPQGPVVLVPVPNSKAVYGGSPDFPTAKLAQEIANSVGPRASVETELWWNEKMEPSSEGGPRFAELLFPHLVFEESFSLGPRVLVDDVLTSGGHLRACAAKLREAGYEPQFAICCGRTFHEQRENPFDVPVEELSDFDPANPFGFGNIILDEAD